MAGAMASVALGGWIMSQAAAASKATATAPASATPARTAKPLLGPLTPEQLAALQFSLPKQSQPAAAPLRPAPAPKRVVAAAPPAATTGTS